MINVIAVTVVVAFTVVAWRIGTWHSRESEYWRHVAAVVRLQPDRDAYYRPLLAWVRSHRPSPVAKIRRWVPPDDRRAAS